MIPQYVVPLGVFLVVAPLLVFLVLRGTQIMDAQLAGLREMATRRGLEVRKGATLEDFAATGTTGGVELRVERHHVFRKGTPGNDGARDEALVSAKPARPVPDALLVPRTGEGALPPPDEGMHEVTVDGGTFDASLRTLAKEYSAAREMLDPKLRATLTPFGTTRLGARLTSLRCSKDEVLLKLESVSPLALDAATIERAVEVVLGLCA